MSDFQRRNRAACKRMQAVIPAMLALSSGYELEQHTVKWVLFRWNSILLQHLSRMRIICGTCFICVHATATEWAFACNSLLFHAYGQETRNP